MKRFALLALLLAVPCAAQLSYPPSKTVDAADTYFGRTYKDPYRWLENLKDKDVEAWFKAQADLTDGVLAKIPGTEALVKEWMALDKLKPATYSSITYENGRVFYKKTLGGENVGKLYLRDGWDGPEQLLFDPANYKTRDGDDDDRELRPLGGRPVRGDGLLGRRRGIFGDSDPRRREGEACCPRASTRRTAPSAGRWTASPFFYDAGQSRPTSRASRSS